jgi:DNA-binding GntR family transcriptional regulator
MDFAEHRRPSAQVYSRLRQLLETSSPQQSIRISIAAVAKLFDVSRPPAERALRALTKEGLLQRDAAGKFERPPLVRAGPGAIDSILLDDVAAELPEEMVPLGLQRGSWLSIYESVVKVVAAVTAFGSYKVVESAMAEFYGVSRTITNDVLGRLEERGLISRGPAGRWRIAQLSQRQLANIYQLRRTLEPVALLESAPKIGKDFLIEAVQRLDDASSRHNVVPPELSNQLEHDLHTASLQHCLNDRLLGVVQNCQVLRIAQLYMPNQSASEEERIAYIGEHRLVYDALLRGAHSLAAEALVYHLQVSESRAAKRLELASMATPPDVPRYLVPVQPEGD